MSRIEKTFVKRNQPELQGEGSEEEQKIDFFKASECSLPPINGDKHLQNIMDCILPPRKSDHKGQTWLERASTVPATRYDLLALEEKFETELQMRKAKTFGICPIRRQIYDQLFDELIRQVTINCAERGLMLLRVRDEIRLSILSFQSLLESAIAYGIRKAILVEKQQSEAVVERDEEKQKNVDLREKLEHLQKQLTQERLVKEEEVRLLEQTMKDENERLLESNKILKVKYTSPSNFANGSESAASCSTDRKSLTKKVNVNYSALALKNLTIFTQKNIFCIYYGYKDRMKEILNE